jgi:1-deoxy-D-xylulose-5-phosphate reductoisomerase
MSSRRKYRNIVILGSTGSIGENALRVAEAFPDRCRVVGLGVKSSVERLAEQARLFNVKRVAVASEHAARQCRELLPDVTVLSGEQGMDKLAASEETDIVVAAIVGTAGLKPVLAALSHGTDVALATKEALVAGGKIVTAAAAKSGARLLPVDSEHSAIMQCLDGKPPGHVKRLILTASGGPFAGKPEIDFNKVTVEQALNHPTWSMGRKVTIDSATMMNKGLELIEARWLFDIPLERIAVLIHPESIVHSLVEFVDGSVLAQLSVSDMRFAIQHALMYPDRADGQLPSLDLARIGKLSFFDPDEKRFPCLRLARAAGARGGTLPAVLNAANEIAVREFLKGKLSFSGIAKIVEKVMNAHDVKPDDDLDSILAAGRWAADEAVKIMESGIS